MTKFYKVIQETAYNPCDQIHGKNICSGDKIEVKWKDGHLSKHKIKIKIRTERCLEQGGYYNQTIYEAYVVTIVHGTRLLLKLKDYDLTARFI